MDKTDQILAVLKKVDDNFSMDDAFEELDTFTHHELSFDYAFGGYDQVWEHPDVTAYNERNKHPLSGYYFTLYRVKPKYEKPDHSEVWPKFKLILGRIGNTTVYRID